MAYNTGEMSSNAGGLIRWPVFALLPLGFCCSVLQGVSELIKRIAFLKGLIADPTKRQGVKTRRGRTGRVPGARRSGRA